MAPSFRPPSAYRSAAPPLGRPILAAALSACLAAASPARAQTATGAAAALFQEGRDLMDHNDPGQACPKFEASQRIEAKAGTLLNLAVCYQATGRVASAWVRFQSVADQFQKSGETARADFARARAQE